MNKNIIFKTVLAAILAFAGVMTGVGLYTTTDYFVGSTEIVSVQETHVSPAWSVKEPSQSAEYIEGPLVADTGELCVFRLSDKETKADWVIVPPATCYIDSSGSSLAFASNVPSKYTIIAAIVEEGVPKILTHICEYGLQPSPQPSPTPNPDPAPKPNPSPITSLKDWVSQNVPDAGKNKAAALASCYESAASGIESGSIRSREAAFSVIRTASQTKIDIDIWSTFLDGLSEKITEKLAGNNDVKMLGTVFSEIAEGLKAITVSDTGNIAEPEVSVPDILPFTAAPQTSACPDPTGKACQPQLTNQYRRAK